MTKTLKNNLSGKDLLDLTELTSEDLMTILDLALAIKKQPEQYAKTLQGKILGTIFEKNSTRTRVSFEAGMLQLGGDAIVLNVKDTQIGRGEPIKDTAKVLSGYLDAIMIRTFSDKMVHELANYADIPVINGLTDLHHPCQVLADLLTIYEISNTFTNKKLAFIGDGNNMAHSLLIGGALVGLNVTIASPKSYTVANDIFQQAKKIAETTGSQLELTESSQKAAQNADFIVTDVFSSMGFEQENQQRQAIFGKDYQVNQELTSLAQPNYHFLHCLPAHRGEEVTADIIDGAHSVIYQEAENRLHVQKALLVALLTND